MSALAAHWQAARVAIAEERQRAARAFRVDNSDFLPAALELVERPVSPTARATTWVMLLGLVATLTWLTIGRADIVATATGTIVPVEYVKLVQPAEGGIVRAIRVREGQHVRKGEVLVLLDPTLSAADESQAARALLAAEFEVARNLAISHALDGDGFTFAAPSGSTPQETRTQEQLARARLAQIEAASSGQTAEIRAAVGQAAEARIRANKLTATLPLLDEQIAANETLLEKGYVSKLKILELRRQRITEARERDAALQTAARGRAEVMAANSASARTRAEALARVLEDLVKAEADVRLRRDELAKTAQRVTFQRLVAPADGTVAQLAVHTVGGFVEPAKPIMTIVPDKGGLMAEVKILNRDIGFIRVGQRASVKIEAFPYTRHGTLQGRVIGLGTDAVLDERLGPVYVARIGLERTTLAGVRITPGMSLAVDIMTGSRTFLSYLLSPIEASSSEAARER